MTSQAGHLERWNIHFIDTSETILTTGTGCDTFLHKINVKNETVYSNSASDLTSANINFVVRDFWIIT